MRITIDTDLHAVIVPNSYHSQIDKFNEIIMAAGGKKLDYTQYIKDCFEKAISTKVVRQSDLAALVSQREKQKD